jgi:hypothetical protein
MRVDRSDGVCRECCGDLTVVDADDATMTVECLDCGEAYLVEPDAFGDGCLTYWVGFMTERMEDNNDEF